MRTSQLQAFFEGQRSGAQLASDLANVRQISDGNIVRYVLLDDLSAVFHVGAENLLRLCDAVLAGELHPDQLELVAFSLTCSDHFQWKSDDASGWRIDSALVDWFGPPVQDEMTLKSVAALRERLTGE